MNSKSGKFETRPEDLAANNLNRLFDSRLAKKDAPKDRGSFVVLPAEPTERTAQSNTGLYS